MSGRESERVVWEGTERERGWWGVSWREGSAEGCGEERGEMLGEGG